MSETNPETRVEIYLTRWCGYCRAATALLKREGIPYQEFDVTKREARNAIRQRSGWRTVPVIYVNDELVGGYDELNAFNSRGGLDGLKPA